MTDSDYLIGKVETALERLRVLEMTLERRIAPDEVIDTALENVRIDLKLLKSELKRRS